MDCVVAPFDQLLFVAEDEVNTTEPPAQNVVELPAVIVGVAGVGLTVTAIVFDVGEEQAPLFSTTE